MLRAAMPPRHRVFFIPGMFGFGRLAGYDYFNHMRRSLEQRYRERDIPVSFEDVPSPPTSSLRHRARILATTVSRSVGTDDGPVHLVGHSTGGLDARLVLAPSTNLGIEREILNWLPRVRSCVSMNTPHYGTPVASYFTTVSGTRVLYALSLLTVVSLYVGEPSLAIFSRLLAGLGSVDSVFGGELFSKSTDMVLRFVDKEGRAEITDFLSKVRTDQAAVIQTMPESMDLFNATTENNPNVRYGCIASAAPRPRTMKVARRIRSPYAALTAALYTTLYQFASQRPKRYPYARPSAEALDRLLAGLAREVTDSDNDGIVPTLSMIWGELLWAGEADHLDVIGHFHDEIKPTDHVDWLTSGSHFTRQRFRSMVEALFDFQMRE
jgi:triacylglycerol lipase